MKSKFIQVGQIAARDPAGNFLPAIPIFKEETESTSATEAAAITEIGKVFAGKMRLYLQSVKSSG